MPTPIPSVKELGVEDWVPPELREDEVDAQKKRYSTFNSALELKEKEKQSQENILLSGILFLAFAFPAAFTSLVNAPVGFFYNMIIVWVHEAGHGISCALTGGGFICSLSGTLTELLATLVPAAILFTNKKTNYAAAVFLLCAALSIQHAGQYMQSAENPYGTGFGGIALTPQTHDWSVILTSMGLITQAQTIGLLTEQIGHCLALIFIAASFLFIIPTLNGFVPKKFSDLLSVPAAMTTIFFLASNAEIPEIATAALLTLPLLPKVVAYFKRK
ncbi:Uncharacterised protein [uncultured archaeon]|nr:Uncharacterised protein [uncultured archaeon]